MQEHKLLIMRHAKSDWSSERNSDFDRSLAKRGIKTAILMGKWLKENQHVPDRVICSPALRAKQTCQLILKELAISEQDVFWIKDIYDASLNDLLSTISQHSNNTGTLLIIGHNPGLDQLVCHLSKQTPLVNASGKLLTTAALAILGYNSEPISTEPHQAHLQNLIRPRELFGEELF